MNFFCKKNEFSPAFIHRKMQLIFLHLSRTFVLRSGSRLSSIKAQRVS